MSDQYFPELRLHTSEREYLASLRRRERAAMLQVVESGRKRSRVDVPLRMQVLQSTLPEELRAHLFHELEHNLCDKYTTWVRKALQLPLGRMHRKEQQLGAVATALERVKASLDRHATGHDAAKREVLKLFCQTYTGGGASASYALGLEGPPGTGKTHFVKHALAPALGRPLVSIPLGGATDVSYLMCSLYVYEGSKEGRLAAGLVEAGCCDPVIHFDELDKVSTTDRGGEIVNALIHLIDPTANASLRDRYFHGIDLDFSRCTFVFSFNDASRVSPILLDRIRRVHMGTPTDDERRAILDDHVVPRVQRRLGWKGRLSRGAVDLILDRSKGGMRDAERDADHVLTSARMCLLAESGRLMGMTAPVVDEGTDDVHVAFARDVLAPSAKEDDQPPSTMYT